MMIVAVLRYSNWAWISGTGYVYVCAFLSSAVEDLLSAYTSCLDSHDHSVVMATVNAVPELVLLCSSQEANQLLSRLFHLATQSFINCTPHLLQAVDACTRHVFQ